MELKLILARNRISQNSLNQFRSYFQAKDPIYMKISLLGIIYMKTNIYICVYIYIYFVASVCN